MKKSFLVKFPWGIFAGAFAMILSYTILGVVTIKVVSYLMIINSGGDDGLGESPVLIYLWIGIAVFAALMILCIVFYIIKGKKIKKLQSENQPVEPQAVAQPAKEAK